MEFRRLGHSGLVVSAVGLGTNNLGMKLDEADGQAVVHAALDVGITLFDTADSYGQSEERLGGFLRGHRDNVIIATKFGSDVRRRGNDNGDDWGARGSRRYIRRAVEASLRRLQTDWIDLYQLHQPDPQTPIDETLSALDDLVREGKIRYIGHSNFSGWQVAHAEWTARQRNYVRFISAQNEYSLLHREAETDLVPALQEYGLGLLPYFPLASGLLTGKYRRDADAPKGSRIESWGMQARLNSQTFDAIDRLQQFADSHGRTLLDVAIGGLAAAPTVASVIAGATSPAQVQANAAAAQWVPTADEYERLRAIPGI
ncbi:aldo/keto reductase [Jongsikchunia kroppenstedtii]|uniref:aldo/keto reductase n=1 Tax=Jongsikchunia kroppenstedtii TaxID=1121721 RepID=UPI0003624EF3|nr:aldo/keto reductase [Jongsikchunia kroppenstedtii]